MLMHPHDRGTTDTAQIQIRGRISERGQFGLPPASLCCCDSTKVQVFHLHSVTWRLVALQVSFSMTGHRPLVDLFGPVGDQCFGGDMRPRLLSGACPRHSQRAAPAQASDERTFQPTARFDV